VQPIRKPFRDVPQQASLFPEIEEDRAAILRAAQARLAPYRAVMSAIVSHCRSDLWGMHGIEADASELLASAEAFMSMLLCHAEPPFEETQLAAALRAHLIGHRLDADAGLRERAVADALVAVDSVLVRATAVAADELRRLHAVWVRPFDVLVAVNDVLHEFAAHDDGREVGEYELERAIVNHTVAAFLTARVTLVASRRGSAD
jgi:hypothetical protein